MTDAHSAGAAIACGHEVTAAAAREMLEAGGNAFDAIVAAICAGCVAEPVLCSLAGGGYLLARRSGGEPWIYDFFVDTPLERRASDEIELHPVQADFGGATQEFHVGLGAVATPGVVAGLFAIHRDLCRLPLEQLAAPAIRAARQGVVLNDLQAYTFSVVAPICLATPGARAVYGIGNGRLPVEGDCLRQPDLANTLERLVQEGPLVMYRGEFAQQIVALCAGGGGQLTMADLERYTVQRRPALAVDYRNARVLTNPPPSRGGILIAFALRMLDGLAVEERESWLAALAQTMYLTNQARAECDGSLLDPALLARYRAQLRLRPGCNRGTTHISIVDDAGNVAAASLSNGEGCGHVLPGTGLMLNNMLGEEDLNPGGFQKWPPGTRMASMMAPTLLEREGTVTVLGTGGSNRIRSAIVQVLANLIDFEMSPEQAIAAPRIHVEGDLLSIEGGFAESAQRTLEETGLRIERWGERNLFFGGVHVVQQRGKVLAAAGDPRRGGVGVVLGQSRSRGGSGIGAPGSDLKPPAPGLKS